MLIKLTLRPILYMSKVNCMIDTYEAISSKLYFGNQQIMYVDVLIRIKPKSFHI